MDFPRGVSSRLSTAMDLLPYPEDAKLPPIEVPYVCGLVLHEVGLHEDFYFVTHLETLPDCEDWYPADRDEAIKKAQAHLFFGLLYDLWGSIPPLEDIIQHSDTLGSSVVSFKFLPQRPLFTAWDQAAFAQYLRPSLETIYKHLRFIRQLSDLGDVIGLSIEILVWAGMGSSPLYPDNHLLQSRMLLAGWCPYWTKVYCERYSSPVLYYLSGIDRSRHEQHPLCTAEGPCNVYDVDNATYETQHASHCAREACRFFGPDLRKLERIILNRGIPLIRFREIPLAVGCSEDDSDQRNAGMPGDNKRRIITTQSVVKIDIVEHAFGRPFIAVSHVWAGGLGNIGANELPQCQIDYLFRYARQCQQRRYRRQPLLFTIDGDDDDDFLDRVFGSGLAEDTNTVYMWIDTLCIPADKRLDDLEGLKAKCIDKMAHIYALAMHILVVDHNIKDLPSKADDSDVGLAVELVTCPWMCRSWTFQEACLSKDFSFALRDGLINPRKLRKAGGVLSFQRQLFREILTSFEKMPDVLNQAIQEEAESNNSILVFTEVWNELAVRRTTYPEDLHGILAVLLGLSPLEIFQDSNGTKRPPSERMLAIIKSQQSLPLAMLFMPHPEGITLSESCESQGWLPPFPAGRLHMDFGQMYWSADGAGLEFKLADSNSCALIVDNIEPGTTISLSLKQQKRSSSKGIDFSVTSSDISVLFTLSESEAEAIAWDGQFCFVLHGFKDAKSLSGQGACFNYLGMTEKLMRLRYICPIKYYVGQERRANAEEPLSVNRNGRVENKDLQWVDDVTCFMDCGEISRF